MSPAVDGRHTGRSKPRGGPSAPGLVLMVEHWYCCYCRGRGAVYRDTLMADRQRLDRVEPRPLGDQRSSDPDE